MTTPTQFVELLLLTPGVESVEETVGSLSLRAPLSDKRIRDEWIRLRASVPQYVAGIAITEADGDAELEDNHTPPSSQLYRIAVKKHRLPGVLHLFLISSIADVRDHLASVNVVRIAQLTGSEAFSTHRTSYQSWTVESETSYLPSEPFANPRKLCVDLSGSVSVVDDIRPWIVRERPSIDSRAYQAWIPIATRTLLAALANQVSFDAVDGYSYHFSGPPKRSVSLSDAEAVLLFQRLHDGAEWVFVAGRDADVRHLLLASEWARSHSKNDARDLGADALESAQSAYNAHVSSGSKETLKALAELRKSVIEESQKASQRAQDLAGSLWKDLAIASIPLLVKVVPGAAEHGSQKLVAAAALVAALFLLFSFGIQIYINSRYFAHQSESRVFWRRALTAVLSPNELSQFSETPIRQSVDDYKRVRSCVGFIYLLFVVSLCIFAATNLRQLPTGNPTKPQPSASTSNGAKPIASPAGETGGSLPEFCFGVAVSKVPFSSRSICAEFGIGAKTADYWFPDLAAKVVERRLAALERLRELRARLARQVIKKEGLPRYLAGDFSSQDTAVAWLNDRYHLSISALRKEFVRQLREISMVTVGAEGIPTATDIPSIETTH